MHLQVQAGILQVIADGKRMDKKSYFDLVFQCLKNSQLLPFNIENCQWRVDFQKYFELAEIDVDIIAKMKVQYGIGFENVFLINCKKCVLLCENFQIRQNKKLIQTSVYFTVLGCLLDWLIDCGEALQKQEAECKLKWEYCGDYFCKSIRAKDNSVIDILYEKISEGMYQISCCNMKRFTDIIEIIKLAIKSELAVQSANQEVLQEDTILNKSVLFVQIAIEILLAEKEVLTDVDRKGIKDLGYAFALMDDLCDFYEDMETGQMNLLMKQGINNNMEMVIKSAVYELNEKLQEMKVWFNKALYEFVLQEIREWSMSSIELRKRIWSINITGKPSI